MKSKAIKRILDLSIQTDSWKDQENRQTLGKSDEKRKTDEEGEKNTEKKNSIGDGKGT